MAPERNGVDSAQSWVVAAACFVIQFIAVGSIRGSGILFVGLMEYNSCSREEATWPFTIFGVGSIVFAPMTGFLTTVFPVRGVSMLGVVIVAVGSCACFFSTDIYFVSIFYGLLRAAGCSMCVNPIPGTINSSFQRHRASAMGIATAGDSLGALVFPLLIQHLLNQYFLRGTFLLLGGIALQAALGAILLVPVSEDKMCQKACTDDGTCVNELVSADCVEIDNLGSARVSINGEIEDGREINDDMVSEEYDEKEIETGDGLCFDGKCGESGLVGESDLGNREFERGGVLKRSDASSSELQMQIGTPESVKRKMLIMNLGKKLTSDKEYSKQVENAETLATNELKDLKSVNLQQASKMEHVHSEEHPDHQLLPEEYVQLANENDLQNLTSDKLKHVHSDEHPNHKLLSEAHVALITPHEETKLQPSKSTSICNFDVDILKNILTSRGFYLILLGQIADTFLVNNYSLLIVDYVGDKGTPLYKGLFMLTVFPLGQLIGRLGLGWITDRNYLSRPFFLFCVLNLCAVLTLVLTVLFSYGGLLTCGALLGVAGGSLHPVTAVLLSDYLRKQDFHMAVAITVSVRGLAQLPRVPLVGYFRDQVGSYDHLFHITAVMLCLSAFVWLCEGVYLRRTGRTIINHQD